MKNDLSEKIKKILEDSPDPNEENINLQFDYSDLVHLYALECSNLIYLKTMEDELEKSFKKMKFNLLQLLKSTKRNI